MGKPTTQNSSFINHFSHPHRLQLTPATSSPPCSACKLAGGNGRVYSCRPCNFSLHESCSKMKQVITHPSHPSHTLTLLVAPVYDGGYFNCDGCGVIGTGFSYQCSRCDFDIHALCAYKPLSIIHKSHPQHNLKLAFHSPYGANKGFSCDVCLKIGKNQWLYRCVPCEFDAHVGCVTAPQPHLLQQSNSAPTPHVHHSGHLEEQHSLPMRNQGPIARPNRPIGNPNRRPIAQNDAAYGPRRQNNKLGYNVQVGPIGPNELTCQEGQGFDRGSSVDGSGYDGSAGNEDQFEGEVDLEIEYEVDVYEGNEYGEANEQGQEVDGNGLEIVACGDDFGAACSESEFGGSGDSRSQCNDLPDADLYPPSVRTNQRSSGGRKKDANPNGLTGQAKNMGRSGPRAMLQGSKNLVQSPRGPQTRRVPNVRNNVIRTGGPARSNRSQGPVAFNGPQGFNGPFGGPSNAFDNGSNNEVDGTEMYGGDYGESYGDNYAVGDGDCNFEDGAEYVDDGCERSYDESYGENDFESYSDITGGSESMYDGEDSQYSGLNDEPDNQYLPMIGPVIRPGINNQNQFGPTGRPRNMGSRGGTTYMNRYQSASNTQPRPMGRPALYRSNPGSNGPNGGSNVNNGPNGNVVMNTMVQGLCQGFAMNMLICGGGDANGGIGDGGGSSIMGGLFGGESEF